MMGCCLRGTRREPGKGTPGGGGDGWMAESENGEERIAREKTKQKAFAKALMFACQSGEGSQGGRPHALRGGTQSLHKL